MDRMITNATPPAPRGGRALGLSECAAIDHLLTRALAHSTRPSTSRKRALIDAIVMVRRCYPDGATTP